MRPHRSAWAFAFAAACAVLGPSAALAGPPTAKDRADAKALVAEAKAASKQKRFADAAEALRKADALDPNPQTKLDLARALIEAGKLVEASQALHAVVDAPATTPGAKKVAAAAKKLLGDLEPRIPWIKIAVIGPDPAQTSTTIDGKEVDAAQEIPFDPGDHTVVAEADGYERAERRVSLADGEHELVKLKLPKLAAEPVAKTDETSSGGSVVPAAIAFGVGAVGLGVGAVFGIIAFNQTSTVEESCTNGVCPADQTEPLSLAKTDGTVSTIGFIVGGVGVATGVVLLLTSGGGGDAEADKAAHVKPWIGAGQAGLAGTF